MGKMKLTILGSMGWMPVRNRQTCCYCLEYPGTLILFDAGTGLARLAEPWGQDILNRCHRVLLLLSHYHLDHTAGLIYLSHFFKNKTVHIAGPGQSIYGKSAQGILTSLIAPPYFGRPLPEFPLDLIFHDLGTGTTRIEGIVIDTLLQEHSDPSLGIRVDNKVCYITDTKSTPAAIDFSRNCSLLLHESWFDTQEYAALTTLAPNTASFPAVPHKSGELNSHSCVMQAAETALNASVEKLILIHLNPSYDEKRLLLMEHEARQIFANSRLANDGETIPLAG